MLSIVAPRLQLMIHTADGRDAEPILCLGGTKWGALCLQVERVADDSWVLYRLVPKVHWVHILEPNNWNVLPHRASSPLDLQTHRPESFANIVLIRQDGAPVSLFKHIFAQKVTLTYDELHKIADYLSLELSGRCSRIVVLEAICRRVCRGEPQSEIDLFAKRCLELDGKPPPKIKVDRLYMFPLLCRPGVQTTPVL